MVFNWKSNWSLRLYNFVKPNAKLVFNYPIQGHLQLYHKYLSKSLNHLEIGVASAYDLINCDIENNKSNINITLMDYDDHPLNMAKKQLLQHGFNESNLKTICTDILQLKPGMFEANNINKAYDTIAMGFLLHCIPGSMNEKFSIILNNLSSVMDENTKLFGMTVCNPTQEILKRNRFKSLGGFVISTAQRQGDMYNTQDTPQHVEDTLKQYFDDYKIEQVEFVTVFEAANFKLIKRFDSV